MRQRIGTARRPAARRARSLSLYWATAAVAAAAVATGAVCDRAETQRGRDAAADASEHETPSPVEAGAQALAVDFTVTGCPSFDSATPRCTGTAPLTLSFVPVTSPQVGTFQWDFGDGTPRSSLQAPTHTFTLPGTHDVRLTVAAELDTASRTRPSFVVVTPPGAGWPCEVDAQCHPQHACLCRPGTAGCPAAFVRGICTSSCEGACSESGTVCADLARSAGVDPRAAGDPWRRPQCLASCGNDADCAPGLRCRWLPGRGPGPAWVKACFLATPAEVGASCRDATETPAGPSCITGACFDLGSAGVCSMNCAGPDAAAACPPGTGCARLGDGRALCLAVCDSAADVSQPVCHADPLLACELPGAPGSLGFTRMASGSNPPPATTTAYCAPRRCAQDTDCGPAGTCTSSGGGRHCTRRS